MLQKQIKLQTDNVHEIENIYKNVSSFNMTRIIIFLLLIYKIFESLQKEIPQLYVFSDFL